MIVVDASVAIGHLSGADAWHVATQVFLADVAGSQLAMHPLTMAEVLAGAVAAGRELAVAADLAAAGIEAMVPDEAEPLRLARLRATSGLKMPDCCVLSAAMQLAAPMATFDDRLARAALVAGVPLALGGR